MGPLFVMFVKQILSMIFKWSYLAALIALDLILLTWKKVKVSLSFCRGVDNWSYSAIDNCHIKLVLYKARSKVKIEDNWLKSTVPLETPLSVDKQKKTLRGWKHSNAVLDCYYMFFTDDELAFSEFSKKSKCFSGWKMHAVTGSHLHENGPWDVVATVMWNFNSRTFFQPRFLFCSQVPGEIT